MSCRKDFMDLGPTELDRLAGAFNDLESRGRISALASMHDSNFSVIHWGPVFLPWHRHFLLLVEQELRSFDARVTLPYWDQTRSDSQDLDSGRWKSFFGGRNNSGGRFDHWSYSRRSNAGGNSLASLASVISELEETSFQAFRGANEPGSHVRPHNWVGGDMASGESPLDPLFYLHHCNVDRQWAIWQLNHAGEAQYTTGAAPSDSGTAVAAIDEAMSGGATPGSMLDHRALGYTYPTDDRILAERPTWVSGDPNEISLVTSSVIFNDVPESETTVRAVLFDVTGCDALYFEVTAAPIAPFSLHSNTFVAYPTSDFPTNDLRFWIRYTGTTAGATDSGTISIRALDLAGTVAGQWDNIPIEANTVQRPTASVVMVLDESGSMLAQAGGNRTRLEALQKAATTLVDELFDDNGIALVAFDETAEKLTDLADAGGIVSSVRVGARSQISNHGPPDEYPHTSIGAGLQRAAQLYADASNASNYDVRATLVFTDGIEDRDPRIADVADSIHERVYAVGVANAANVDSAKLQALADDSGGYMLMSGAVPADDDFLLEKFFIQILVGVINRQIVRDPRGWIEPGVISREPFWIAQSDIAFDAIALTRHPGFTVIGLETPDGTVLQSPQIPGTHRTGTNSVSYRVTLPVIVNGKAYWEGRWALLLTAGRKRKVTATHALSASVLAAAHFAFPYQAIVHAQSNLFLRARVDRSQMGPGATLYMNARLTEYGIPLATHAAVQVRAVWPDGSARVFSLVEGDPGSYSSEVTGELAGIYRFRVLASGFTAQGQRFEREQLLTTVLGHRSPERSPDPGDRAREIICELLECLSGPEVLTPRARRHLKELGIDWEAFRSCLERFCKEDRESIPPALLELLKNPAWLRAITRRVP